MRTDVADACKIGGNTHGKYAVWRALEGSAKLELDRESSVNLSGTRFDAAAPSKTTWTNYKVDCQPCHVPARASDRIYVQGYPALKQ
jgi:hypothetical protein